ncbi:cilia- and flagella-associated protein 97 [Apis mellifera caucasica]|uniref:Cilia- and flagella-associated protein 97 n=1 Tax=Apis mellifera TaxID=7460 RepID=A0A7M7GJ07_APIME|nr:cilia- and flagella-associated protein 97 [Apis mellifera]KAG6796558.1 cilia- and flagella-associated protein 97 [Apis mellifera caucasica]KAG9436636.1 cilia- and flagella-associated protein 97 [Apis mellifera carnica]|eukprot:XP_003250111.1 cilia- and flagella-associated protein 97 [Apis mellifera]
MSCLKDTQPDCRCQYTLTLTDEIVHEQFSEMKDSFNHVPSIHEVDEEETDEENACDLELKTPKDIELAADQLKDTADTIDEDSIYSNDSFCSDESCDESEETNGTLRSLNDSHFSPHPQISTRKFSHEEIKNEQEKSENITQNNEIINSIGRSSISEDNSIGIKQVKNKRKNMSFTDEEIRKIEWENQILLRKIMAQQKPKEKVFYENIPPSRISSSAINRKKLQKKIENENILLLQRIQQTKSRVMNNMTKPGCRQTIL